MIDRLGHGLHPRIDLMRSGALMRLGQLMAFCSMVLRHGHTFRGLILPRFLFAKKRRILSGLVLAMLCPTIVLVARDNRLLLPVKVL